MSRVGSVVQCGLIYNSRQNYSSIRGKKRISPAQFQKKSLSCFLREDLDFLLMYLRCFHEFFSRKEIIYCFLVPSPFLPMRDLWMWGITPPPAMVALISVSNSSSPRMANCKWRGVIRFTFKSLEALPANSKTWKFEEIYIKNRVFFGKMISL